MKFRRSPDVVARAIDQEIVLLDLTSGRYFGLNATGAAIWDVLAVGEPTAEEIAGKLAATFAAPEADILQDVRSILDELHQHRLIKRGA